MANHAKPFHSIVMAIKAAALLAGVAALGFVALSVVEQSSPWLNASAGFALEGQRSNAEATTESTNVQSTMGVAAAAVPVGTPSALPARDYDYFPDHYVNQATKIDEQAPTF